MAAWQWKNVCLSNSDCATSFCDRSQCRHPASHGDPCSPALARCPAGTSCRAVSRRCTAFGYAANFWCSSDVDCRTGLTCHAGLCVERRAPATPCMSSAQCADASVCDASVCKAVCIRPERQWWAGPPTDSAFDGLASGAALRRVPVTRSMGGCPAGLACVAPLAPYGETFCDATAGTALLLGVCSDGSSLMTSRWPPGHAAAHPSPTRPDQSPLAAYGRLAPLLVPLLVLPVLSWLCFCLGRQFAKRTTPSAPASLEAPAPASLDASAPPPAYSLRE